MSAIQLVLSGGIYVPPNALQLGNSPAEEPAPAPIENAGLTPRQTVVIGLISEGRSNKEIAAELSLTPGTVKMHLSRIYKVLGAKSRTDAVAKFTRLKASASKQATSRQSPQ